MTEPDIDAGLQNLRQSLGQLKALLAWEQLKQCEAQRGWSPACQMYDPTEEQLRNEYSFFVAISWDMRSVLNDRSWRVSKATREDFMRQLAGIEKEVHGLNLDQRFWGS